MSWGIHVSLGVLHFYGLYPTNSLLKVIKIDVLRQGSKRNARDIQDIIVADDGYGAPKMDGKGTKIERTWKWAANPKKLIVHWDEIPLEWQACSSQTDYLGIASHEMPMRRSSRSCFIILFPMARRTLEVKLGTDIGFLRKCSQYSIWFQGFGVLLKGGRLWTTVRYHCGHSLCTDLSRGQGKPTGWHSNSDHNAEFLLEAKILCEAKELRCFFSMSHTMYFSPWETTENCSDLLFTTSFEVFCGLKGIGLLCLWSQPSTFLFQGQAIGGYTSVIKNPYSACDDPHPTSPLEWLKVAKILNHVIQQAISHSHQLCTVGDLSVWQVPWNATRSETQKHNCEESRDWPRGIATFFLFALGFS